MHTLSLFKNSAVLKWKTCWVCRKLIVVVVVVVVGGGVVVGGVMSDVSLPRKSSVAEFKIN